MRSLHDEHEEPPAQQCAWKRMCRRSMHELPARAPEACTLYLPTHWLADDSNTPQWVVSQPKPWTSCMTTRLPVSAVPCYWSCTCTSQVLLIIILSSSQINTHPAATACWLPHHSSSSSAYCIFVVTSSSSSLSSSLTPYLFASIWNLKYEFQSQ